MADAPESTPKIDSLRAKVGADPKSRHFYPLAEELRKVGQLEEAEKVLRAGLEHHSSYLSAWIGLGRVLKDRGTYSEAVDVLMRGLSLDPENVVAAKLLANVYLAMGEKVEAIKKFKLVHALMPSDEEAEEQIALLEQEIHGGEAEPAPAVQEAAPAAAPDNTAEESPHDSTEPPFPMDDESVPPAPQVEETELPAASAQPNFDLTNPDPFSLGSEAPAEAEAEAPAEPELTDEAQPFADAELPESAIEQAQADDDPFASVPAPPEEAEKPQRAPSSEDVWAEEEEEPRSVPESAATVTMARILAEQGDVERARETFNRVLERDPGNAEARQGLAALTEEDDSSAVSTRVGRLEAWRRKVAGS